MGVKRSVTGVYMNDGGILKRTTRSLRDVTEKKNYNRALSREKGRAVWFRIIWTHMMSTHLAHEC